MAVFTAAGYFAGRSAERNAVRTEVRITAVEVWGSSYEFRFEQDGPGGPVRRWAVYENSDHLSADAKPEPFAGDLWRLCAAAKLEAEALPEAAPAADAERVMVTAVRGGEAVSFVLTGRLASLARDRSVAPHLFDLLQYASTGRPKAYRMIEPPVGPGSEVQVRVPGPSEKDGGATDGAREEPQSPPLK